MNNTEEEKDYSGILLPIANRVSAKMLTDNLVPIKPMGHIGQDKLKEIEIRLKVENRDNYIDSILNSTKFEFKRLEQDREYKELLNGGLPKGNLMYLDYTYDKNNK